MIRSVQTSKRALKSLEKAPKQAVAKFMLWRSQVIENGLAKIQQIPGYESGLSLEYLCGEKKFSNEAE
jgi:hypothetical protein